MTSETLCWVDSFLFTTTVVFQVLSIASHLERDCRTASYFSNKGRSQQAKVNRKVDSCIYLRSSKQKNWQNK